jgi:dihydroorotate dehydrogenase (NAD+) catalytic subunit
MNGSDAIEFLIAGASAVEIGTATLLKPSACLDVQNEMISIAESDGVDSLKDYSGTLIAW